MAMEKKTILDQIEVKSDGVIFIRLMKQVVDGDFVVSSEPHRSVIEPHVAVAVQAAAVNSHLSQMGWPAISADDLGRLESHGKVARTDKAVAAWKARIEATTKDKDSKTQK